MQAVLLHPRKVLFELKVAAYSFLWKFRGLKGRTGESELYPRNKLYWIDPYRIQVSLDHPGAKGLPPTEGWSITPALEADLIVPGDWDLHTIPFEQMDVWQAFKYVFAEGGRWQDTPFFQRNLAEIGAGRFVWGCHNEDEFCARLNSFSNLYSQINQHGFRTQDELEQTGYPQTKKSDEISVHIGRDGDYIFADGRHRLCIARLLRIEKIPVRICRRHRAWVSFRKELLQYARSNRGKLYAPILHPDLADLPRHHDDDRIQLLRRQFEGKSGSLLDIGSHWGYFCHCFEQWGYTCTAIESSPVNLRFMRKIKRAERRQFTIHAGSALEYDYSRSFDLVLALNIFHHFIKSEPDFSALQRVLAKMRTKVLVFEPHLPNEEQMAASYRNFEPNDFVNWVKEKGAFRSVRELGAARDGRTLFVLER